MNDQEILRVIDFVQQTRSPLRKLMQLSDEEPIWNITTFLMRNEILGVPVSVASLVQVTGVPYTTSRRLVARLISEGHIVRQPRTKSGKTYVLHPSQELADNFRKYAGDIKSLIARTLGMRPTKETEDDYYFGGTPSLSQTMLPRNLFQKQYTENLELRFLLGDDNYFMAMRNMWADLRCNLASRRNFDLLQPAQLYAKAVDNALRPTSEYDVVTIDTTWLAEFAEKGYVRPVGELQKQGVNPHGFDPTVWSMGLRNGVEYGVPIYCSAQLLALRRDLFSEKHVEAPKTFDDVIEAGREFHDPGKARYGIVWDAAPGMPVAQSFMFFMGASGTPAISLPRGRQGFSVQGLNPDAGAAGRIRRRTRRARLHAPPGRDFAVRHPREVVGRSARCVPVGQIGDGLLRNHARLAPRRRRPLGRPPQGAVRAAAVRPRRHACHAARRLPADHSV